VVRHLLMMGGAVALVVVLALAGCAGDVRTTTGTVQPGQDFVHVRAGARDEADRLAQRECGRLGMNAVFRTQGEARVGRDDPDVYNYQCIR